MYRRIEALMGKAPARLDALAAIFFEDDKALPAGYAALDRELGGALTAAIGRAEWPAGRGRLTWLYPAKGAGRVAVLGLGKRAGFDGETLRVAAATFVSAAEAAGAKSVRFETGGVLRSIMPDAEFGRAIGEGLGIGNFKFTRFKGAGEAAAGGTPSKPPTATLKVHVPLAAQAELAHGLIVAESINLARHLAATPPNIANPKYLCDFARKMARQVGLRCTVVDAARAKALGMGGLLAVGGAGSTPPALIVLEHRPRRAAKSARPTVLVGKAVTFDTGGYSIKPTDSMVGMKYDKCGGAAVIATLHAAARLKLDTPLVGVIPAAENMIGETAYRPSDILTMSNGVTVEVTNTDAEGRLILGDALVYACRNFNPAAVIDLATLTGGAVVALGSFCAALFCNDTDLRGKIESASKASGERVWRLPLWEEHRTMIKGPHGDIVNAAGREASPISGAAFLSFFVGPNGDGAKHFNSPAVPWAHLDIAGTADVDRDRNWSSLYPKGPTGYGVRLLVRLLEG
jgi:leucyl aminopeptidase